MSDVRVAVVGLGMGMVRARQVVETPGAELVAVADLREDRREAARDRFECRVYDSCDALLADADDIEVVFVLTESGTHARYGMQAARAGKHVISTKPIDTTVDKASAFCRVCEECGVRLMVDFQMRYTTALQRVRAAVAQGALGRPLLGEVRLKWWRGEDYYEGWHGTWELDGGGSVMNQAVHFVDALCYALGDVEEVFAYSGVAAHANCETEDLTSGVLRFANGAQGLISTTTTFPGTQYDLVEIHGTQGAVALDLGNLLRWEFTRPDSALGTWNAQTGDNIGGASGPYEPPLEVPAVPANVVADAVAVLRHGAEPVCSGRDAVRAVAVTTALYESARTRQPAAVRRAFD
jgi:predicted dehydrogenase